ncbi:MAG: hypothetical protein A3F91_09705 [Flavobacteria bacterium RIFCSPLOWO2_12_FULL_35_11]|nr:MAG: hypothetical protein A3F91_09705 [Flavobacteria bacterium RIFCSPLOWO2_12_FULL_35_11]
MTLIEFDNQRWAGGMKAEFEGKIYDVINCDFEEKTVGLDIKGLLVEIPHTLCTIVDELKIVNEPVFDGDGDITDNTFYTIKEWNHLKGWGVFIEFVKECYDLNYGKINTTDDEIIFITGGWSCNERVIQAIQKNHLFMGLFWEASYKGGKMVFRLPKCENKQGVGL